MLNSAFQYSHILCVSSGLIIASDERLHPCFVNVIDREVDCMISLYEGKSRIVKSAKLVGCLSDNNSM